MNEQAQRKEHHETFSSQHPQRHGCRGDERRRQRPRDGTEAQVKASITNEAIENLDLKIGDKACAIIKATDVMVGID